MAERASTAKTILSNVGWLVAAEVAGRLVTFIALMHLTRALGPAPLGIVEFGLAVFALLSLVSLGGVEILAKRQVARTTRGIGRVAGTSLVLSWTWLGVAVALLALFAPLVERPAPTFLVATGFIVAAALTPLGLRFAFLGRERMDRLAIASVAGQLVWAASVLVFVESTDDVLLVPALWLAGEATRVILLMVAYKGLFGRIRMPRARGLRVWAAASVPVSLGRIARGSLYLIDVFILGLIAPLAVVGLYGVALRLPLFVVSVGAMAHQALFPTVARLVPAGDREGLASVQGAALRAALSIGLAAALTLSGSADAFLGVLFGEPYRAAAPFLAILVWKIPLMAVAGLYRNVVWAARPALEARLSMAGAGLTVVAAVIATVAVGAIGCAVAMVAGEALLLVLYVGAARSHPSGLGPWIRRWLPLQAIALLGVGIWLASVGGRSDWVVMGSAVAVGALAAAAPLAPFASELRRALRAGPSGPR